MSTPISAAEFRARVGDVAEHPNPEAVAAQARSIAAEHNKAAQILVSKGKRAGSLLASEKRTLDAHLNNGEALEAIATEAESSPVAVRRNQSHAATLATGGAVTNQRTGVRAYDEVGRVSREERTYTPEKSQRGSDNGGASFIRDAVFAELGDWQARERLARHVREAEVEGEVQSRATTTSSFAGLVVPQYLVQYAALVSRAGRPLANACTRLPLPEQGMSFLIPRGTTGVSAAAQATEGSAVSNTDEVFANVTVPVATIAGQQVVSRQSLERGTPGLDQLIYADLAGAYASELDRQIINGTGASGEMLGFRNTASIYQATAFSAAATPTTFWQKTTGAINSIEAAGTNVGPADLIVMHPRRFNWLLQQVDSAGRPLIVPTGQGAFNAFGTVIESGQYGSPHDPSSPTSFSGVTIKGYLLGLPVVVDANIPTNLGTGSLEDVVAVLSSKHHLLFEDGDGMPNMLRFEQTNPGNLQINLAAYNYVAYTAARLPLATSLVGGNAGTSGFGLTTVTF